MSSHSYDDCLGSGRHFPSAILKQEHEKAPFFSSFDSARFAETKRQFDPTMIWRSGENLNENRCYIYDATGAVFANFDFCFWFFFLWNFLIRSICKCPFQITRKLSKWLILSLFERKERTLALTWLFVPKELNLQNRA